MVKTTLGQPYDFPRVYQVKSMKMSVERDFPVYISPDCRPLNRFYQTIERLTEPELGQNESVFDPFKNEPFPVVFRPNRTTDQVLPAPKLYQRGPDYQDAMEEWFQYMRRYFAAAMLPVPLAGIFYLPGPPKIFAKDEKMNPGRFRTFKATQWPLLPNNYNDMIDTILDRKPINPEEQFKEQIPKREVILHKHHMTAAQQWMAQMMPAEPLPFMYDTYDDFQLAYKMWSNVCALNMRVALMKANEFTKIAMMDIVEQSKEKSRPVLPPPKPHENPMDLTWAPYLVFYPEKIERALGRLYDRMQEPRKVPEPQKNVVDVIGVDKKEFLEEMQKTGSYRYGVPQGFYIGRPLENSEPLKRLLSEAKAYDFRLVWRLLGFDASQEQINAALRMEMNRTMFVGFISNIISQREAFRYLKKLADYAPQYKYRISFLLTAILRNDSSTQLVRLLMMQGNLDLLDSAVHFLNLTSPKRVNLIPMITSQNRGFEMISKCYLVSVLLDLMSDCGCMRWYQELVRKGQPSRKMCFYICQYLKDNRFLEAVRSTPPDSEMYKVLLMLLNINSKEIHRLLLGKDFLIWINNSPLRPGLMNTICHSRAIYTAAQLLVEALNEKVLEPFSDLFKTMRPETVSLFAQVCCGLLKHFDTHGCRISGQTILPLFEAACECQRECVSQCIVPLADIISSRTVISNFAAPDFQPLLMRAVCSICKVIGSAKGVDFREKVQTLIMLARDDQCCFAMAQVPGFKRCLISHLTDGDVVCANRTWELFMKMTSYQRVLGELISDETKSLISRVVDNNTERMPLKRMLDFMIKVLERKDPNTTRKLVEILSSALGQISCLYKTRYVKYKGDPVMVALLDSFYETLLGIDDTRFLDLLADHMMDRVETRNRAKTLKHLKSHMSMRPPDLSVILSS